MIRLLDLLRKYTGFNAANVSSNKVNEAIEHVIDAIDPKLRLVPSYQQKLNSAVSTALNYIDNLVEQVPGPYDFSHIAYINEPNVRAYFASPEIMQDVFSNSSELQSFFADVNNSGVDTCYTLLCSNKEEKSVFGSEMMGDFIQHDIRQTAVNFFDYKVLSPASTVYDVRKGIKQCIFDGFITYVLQHIVCIKTERRDLHDQQRILHAQLRTRQSQGNGLSNMLIEGHADKWQSSELQRQYLEAGKKLESMLKKQDVLSFYLDQVSQILSRPEDFIQLNVACFRLSDMRIRLSDDSPQTANTVCFSEIEIANVMRRVIAIAGYTRDEMKISH